MVEDQQVFGKFVAILQGDLPEPRLDLLECRGAQARSNQSQAERVRVTPDRHATEQGRLDGRGAPAHERIVNPIARLGEAFDEKTRKLRLETSPVADLMQATGLPLPSRPELVDIGRHLDLAA